MLFDLIPIWLWRDLDCFNAKARQYKDSTIKSTECFYKCKSRSEQTKSI